MNLSPAWVAVLERNGFEALHWSTVGAKDAEDRDIFHWARDNDYIVFTNDLGFGAILAAAGSTAPSVIQVRTQDVTPGSLEETVVAALRQYEQLLADGALITVEESRLRSRILPLRR